MASQENVKKAPGLIPASEERVYLYQKTGKDSLEELEAKRSRYVELDKSLELLPRKLRHPGLVPLGPGLYGHGQMVNTNEVMVLLGDSYFAEMSAHDARGVVKRRLKIIDDKISAVEVGTEEVAKIVAEVEKKEAELLTKKEAKLVPKQPAFKRGFLDEANNSSPPASGRKPPRSPRPLRKVDSPKKRVSFVSDTKKGVDAEAKSDSKMNARHNTVPNGSSSQKRTSSGVKEKNMHSIVEGLLENFEDTVKIAEGDREASEIVNFGEILDDDGNVKEVQGLPSVSGNTGAKYIYESDDVDEDELNRRHAEAMQSLMEMERMEDEEEKRGEEEEVHRKEHEVRSFGSGFAKGFFGKSAARKTTQPKAKTEVEEIDATKDVEEPTVERAAMKNVVREKVGSERRRRRRQKQKDPEQPVVFNVMRDKRGCDNGKDDEEIAPRRMSKFKQMRQGMK